jgi:hypothetical protein
MRHFSPQVAVIVVLLLIGSSSFSFNRLSFGSFSRPHNKLLNRLPGFSKSHTIHLHGGGFAGGPPLNPNYFGLEEDDWTSKAMAVAALVRSESNHTKDTFHSNSSMSGVVVLQPVDTKNVSRSQFNDTPAASSNSTTIPEMIDWWEKKTAKRKGLLIWMVPAVLGQLIVLNRAVPFVIDRLSQYMQPIFIMTSLLLWQRNGPIAMQALLWSSIALGIGCMFNLGTVSSTERFVRCNNWVST